MMFDMKNNSYCTNDVIKSNNLRILSQDIEEKIGKKGIGGGKKGFVMIETIVYILIASIIISVMISCVVVSYKTYKHYSSKTYVREYALEFDDFLRNEFLYSFVDINVKIGDLPSEKKRLFNMDKAPVEFSYFKNENPKNKGIKAFVLRIKEKVHFYEVETNVMQNKDIKIIDINKIDTNKFNLKFMYKRGSIYYTKNLIMVF